MSSLIFVDCEAGFDSPCVGLGKGMTEFGAVELLTRDVNGFHGKPDGERTWGIIFKEFEQWLHNFPATYIFVSDNPAYDWQWINNGFWVNLGYNPFGHSARRIGDFYAGLTGDFRNSNRWKRLRMTKHDHHPVHDARGNAEAFARILAGERV